MEHVDGIENLKGIFYMLSIVYAIVIALWVYEDWQRKKKCELERLKKNYVAQWYYTCNSLINPYTNRVNKTM